MAQDSYIIDKPAGVFANLTTCETCMPDASCPVCGTTTIQKTIIGEDPDTGTSITWNTEDISQYNTRSDKTDRWPYQIITEKVDLEGHLSCDSNCAYLIRIQYKLQTSSKRRSFFQCGFSDMWIVERWDYREEGIQEIYYVANSVPFDWRNENLSSKYITADGTLDPVTLEPVNKKSGSSATATTYFNPYGLREEYDVKKDSLETHCGTLMFFARGDDVIKFRLAQHTHLNDGIDINPDSVPGGLFPIRTDGTVESADKDYSRGNYEVEGNFYLKTYVRPIPGKLKLSDKSVTVGAEIERKYHPKIWEGNMG